MSTQKPRKFQIVSDIHGSACDEAACRGALAFCKDFKPDIRVIAGDLWDFAAIRKGASEEERTISMREDFEAGRDFALEFFKGGKENHLMYGNHCLVDTSEVLTRTGWKTVTEVTTEDEVAQFKMESGEISYAKPQALVHRHADHVYSIEGRYTHQVVSEGHDVVVYGMKKKAKDLLGRDLKESAIRTSGFLSKYATPRLEDTPDWMRLLTWVVADGCIVNLAKYNPTTIKARVQFKLSLTKKIDALRALLDRLNVKYTFALCKKSGINKLQPYYIRIYGDDARAIVGSLDGVKKLPERWAFYPVDRFKAVTETIEITDGSPHFQHTVWATTSKEDIDLMQRWAVHCGCDFAVRKLPHNASGFANAKQQWGSKFRFSATDDFDQSLKIEAKKYDREVYCVTMPAGTVVTRYNGKVAFTGNCTRAIDLSRSKDATRADLGKRMVEDIEALARRCKAKLWPYDSRHGVLQLGHLNVIHGFHTGVSACAQHSRTYGNCVFGHVHSIESYQTPGLKQKEARAIGCLCKLDQEYADRNTGKLRWSLGFGFGFLFSDGSYQFNQARMINGVFHCSTNLKEYS